MRKYHGAGDLPCTADGSWQSWTDTYFPCCSLQQPLGDDADVTWAAKNSRSYVFCAGLLRKQRPASKHRRVQGSVPNRDLPWHRCVSFPGPQPWCPGNALCKGGRVLLGTLLHGLGLPGHAERPTTALVHLGMALERPYLACISTCLSMCPLPRVFPTSGFHASHVCGDSSMVTCFSHVIVSCSTWISDAQEHNPHRQGTKPLL